MDDDVTTRFTTDAQRALIVVFRIMSDAEGLKALGVYRHIAEKSGAGRKPRLPLAH